MKLSFKLTTAFLFCLLVNSPVGAKGITYKIVVRGESLAEPLIISDDEIVNQFRIWAGPNSRWRIGDGEWQTDYNGAFVDFQAGLAHLRAKGLLIFDIEFHLMDDPTGGYWDEAYIVRYAALPEEGSGYFYLPIRRPSINGNFIYHGVEGNWLHSSDLWETVVGPIIRQHLIDAE